jgi:DNA repair exonuclease SbcCD ATPase subunit
MSVEQLNHDEYVAKLKAERDALRDRIEVIEPQLSMSQQACDNYQAENAKLRAELQGMKHAKAALQAIEDAGYVVVPMELPRNIIEQNLAAWATISHQYAELYKAMISAAAKVTE